MPASNREIASAKLYASEVAGRASDQAVQIHGGYGYVKEYHVERLMRDSKITQIYEGTNDIHQAALVTRLSQRSSERVESNNEKESGC